MQGTRYGHRNAARADLFGNELAEPQVVLLLVTTYADPGKLHAHEARATNLVHR